MNWSHVEDGRITGIRSPSTRDRCWVEAAYAGRVSWTEKDLPDLAGRTAIVNGANSGIGLKAATALAEHGATSCWRAATPGPAARPLRASAARPAWPS